MQNICKHIKTFLQTVLGRGDGLSVVTWVIVMVQKFQVLLVLT